MANTEILKPKHLKWDRKYKVKNKKTGAVLVVKIIGVRPWGLRYLRSDIEKQFIDLLHEFDKKWKILEEVENG